MGVKNSKSTLEEALRQPRMQPTANTEFSQQPALDAVNSQPWMWPTINSQHPLRPTANRRLRVSPKPL